MNRLMPPSYCLLLLSLLLLNVTGCSRQPQVATALPPAPRLVMEGGAPKVLMAVTAIHHLRQLAPGLDDVVVNDRLYLHMDEQWLLQLVDYVDQLIAQQAPAVAAQKGEIPSYPETYVQILGSLAGLTVARNHEVKASVLVGLMVAESRAAWGEIPGDSQPRTYLLALTAEGGLVFDPVTRQQCRLSDFPNKAHLRGVMF